MFAVEIAVLLLPVREVLISCLCPEIRYDESPFSFWNSHVKKCKNNTSVRPVPVAARSKAQVYGRAPAEIVGSNPTVGMNVCLLWVLCVVR